MSIIYECQLIMIANVYGTFFRVLNASNSVDNNRKRTEEFIIDSPFLFTFHLYRNLVAIIIVFFAENRNWCDSPNTFYVTITLYLLK